MLTVRAITAKEDLASLVDGWDALAQIAPRSLALRSGTWVTTWLEQVLPAGTPFCVAAAFDGDLLVGVLPLRRVQGGLRSRLAPLLRTTTDDHTFLGGPMMEPGPRRPEILRALWAEQLRHAPRTAAIHLERIWHVPEAAQIGPDDTHWRPLRRKSLVTGCFFDVSGSYEERWAALGARTKKNLRNCENRLARMGKVTIETLRSPEDADRGLEAFLLLEATGWKGRESTAILQSHPLVMFYRLLVRRLAARGALRIHLLRLDGRTVAAEFCALLGGRLQVHKLAYDETLEQASPGHVLWRHTMESAHADPEIREVDTLYMDAIRARWDGTPYEYADVWWLRRSAGAWLLRALPLTLRDRWAARRRQRQEQSQAATQDEPPANPNAGAEPPPGA